MSLRRQLLLVSLLLLALPWAGAQFIREMEAALRVGQARALQATAEAIATVLGQRPELLYPYAMRRESAFDADAALYAFPAPGPVIVDGYGDGWEEVPETALRSHAGSAPLALHYRAQTRDGLLYLLLRVQDPEIVYENPGLSAAPNGDRLVLRLWRGGRRQDYAIATSAPGQVRARAARRQPDTDPAHIRGYWQDAQGGYSLELELPLAYTGGRLGFYVIDERPGQRARALGTAAPADAGAPPWLVYRPEALRQALAPFAAPGSEVLVVDRGQWQLAELPAAQQRGEPPAETFWLLRLVYRSILSAAPADAPPAASGPGQLAGEEIAAALSGEVASRRYRDPAYRSRTLLSAAAPVHDAAGVFGAVVVRQSGEPYLGLADQAFSRLLLYSLLALAVGSVGLLAYASLLSWRIRRLSRAAERAVAEDGRVVGDFPRSRARDEIGTLSRQYAELLDRLRAYNDYLQSLSRKLAHELRTPIAVIRSSLDNLEQSGAQTAAPPYLQRAREGLARLQHILSAMSEASRLEQSIRGQQPAPFDLVPLLREVFEAYRAVYPRHRLSLAVEPAAAPVRGVPELVVQALDKLLDNAAAFCPEGGTIALRLDAQDDAWLLAVENEGPPLPAGASERLFEPMVSLRENTDGAVHLGLGLHIVRLIAEFHRGSVRATNLPGDAGVIFTLVLPRQNGRDSVPWHTSEGADREHSA